MATFTFNTRGLLLRGTECISLLVVWSSSQQQIPMYIHIILCICVHKYHVQFLRNTKQGLHYCELLQAQVASQPPGSRWKPILQLGGQCLAGTRFKFISCFTKPQNFSGLCLSAHINLPLIGFHEDTALDTSDALDRAEARLLYNKGLFLVSWSLNDLCV